MHYTLHQLYIFTRIVETRSVTRAAEMLHMTQPAVSIQLKNFQAQFDIPLTEVVGRQLYITGFGMEIHAMAIRILNEVAAINEKTLSFRGMLTGKLRLAVVSTGKYVMPYFLDRFLRAHPGVELSMDVTNRQRVVDSLTRNEVDFALVSMLPPKGKYNEEQLLENELFLVGPSSSTQSRRMKPSELEQLPLLFREEGSATRISMERFLAEQRIHAPKRLGLSSNEAVKQAVVAGLGYSIMPLIGLRHELRQGELVILPMKGLPIRTAWRLVWAKGKKPTPVAEAYLAHIRTEKAAISNDAFGWTREYQGTK